jgi:hypothetical protein
LVHSILNLTILQTHFFAGGIAAMSLESRTSILDWNTAQSIGKEIVIGNVFAFLTPKTWEHPTLGWIAKLLAGSGVVPPRVV